MAGQKVLRNSLFLFGFPVYPHDGSIVFSSFSSCDLSEILSSHWEQGMDDQEWPPGEE